MASIWEELKRRNVVRVAVAYAIVGWLLIEVSTTVLPVFKTPEWIVPVFTFFILLGLPVALVLSWAYELTSDGIERTSSVAESESIAKGTGKKLEYITIVALALALAFVLFDDKLGGPDQEAAVDETATVLESDVQSPAAAVVETQQEILPNSVAVLPFENLSPDPDNAYFAAGIHEEVLNQLVKLSELNVIARTTMVRYANANKSITQVAEELHVETVMEGSVRYADNRVLVTAQLIDPKTNLHLWSDSYNREFADIFAIQADIAMNIANALEAEFSDEEQARLEKIPTNSTEAWELYLKATTERASRVDRLQQLDTAIDLDPEFALAYAQRALNLMGQLVIARGTAAEREALPIRAREDIERALDLDPELPIGYLALSRLQRSTWRFAESASTLKRALDLAPNDSSLMMEYAQRIVSTEPAEALRLGERALLLNPQEADLRSRLGLLYVRAAEYAAAVRSIRNAISLDPSNAAYYNFLAVAELLGGDHDAALDAIRKSEALSATKPAGALALYARAYTLLKRPEDTRRIVAEIRQRDMEGGVGAAIWANVHIALGDYDLALEFFERAIDEHTTFDVSLQVISRNVYNDPVLNSDPGWLAARARIGSIN
jgi:TolB-like protein